MQSMSHRVSGQCWSRRSVDGQFTERLVDRFVRRSLRLVDVEGLCAGEIKYVLSKLLLHDVFLEFFYTQNKHFLAFHSAIPNGRYFDDPVSNLTINATPTNPNRKPKLNH